MQHLILALMLLFSSIVFAQEQKETMELEGTTITVTVVNALSDKGTIKFALHDKESFMKREPLFSAAAAIENGMSEVLFKSIPNGTYVIICYHDENENDKMDFELNGMPKESYGTSNNVITFGPPEFEASKFEVNNEDIKLEIKF